MEDIPEPVYRIKGWLTVWENKDFVRYLLQAAGPRWRVETDTVECPNKVVIIGDNSNDFATKDDYENRNHFTNYYVIDSDEKY